MGFYGVKFAGPGGVVAYGGLDYCLRIIECSPGAVLMVLNSRHRWEES